MIEFLLQNDASVNARTKMDRLHFMVQQRTATLQLSISCYKQELIVK